MAGGVAPGMVFQIASNAVAEVVFTNELFEHRENGVAFSVGDAIECIFDIYTLGDGFGDSARAR